MRESLQADIQVVRDRVEQSLETANSIVSSIRDIISGRVPFFVSTGISTIASESVTNQEVVPAGAAPNVDESTWNAVVLPAVPVYKMSRSLLSVTDVWREYKVGLGGNPSIENLDRDYKNAWRRAPVERKFYSRRLVLYKQIKSLAEELSVSETVAAENLERSRLAAKKSLDSFQKSLK